MPQHFLGLGGIPRRYADYGDCYYAWNKVSSIGSFITLLAAILFVVILFESFSQQRPLVITYNQSTSLE